MKNKFNAEFFTNNRSRLSKSLPNSLVVISANCMLQKSADEPYAFRQDSSFWYLTGISEPDLVLVINTAENQATLLLPEQNDYQKEWDGKLDMQLLGQISGISVFDYRSSLVSILKRAKSKSLQICQLNPAPERVEPYGFMSNPARRILEQEIKQIESKPKDIRLEMARVREIKQPAEIDAIRSAIDVTGEALAELKQDLEAYKTEKDFERALLIKFLEKGSDGHMFEPIVASGKNAAIIHYRQNDSEIKNNQLVLLDVGAKNGMYGADISRTWSAGTPTKRMKDVFDAVLEVHKQALSRYKPGIFLKEEQQRVNKDLAKQYKKLKIPEGQLPTGISHFLGVDTHDAGDYMAPLREGQILTVEPGIYLPDEGIGVRIEDNLLITKNGAEILSEKIDRNL